MRIENDVISLAYYLPQFHAIQENNLWWGEGFTEWTQLNVAQTYFPDQTIRKPHTSIGQYDLLESSVMTAQWQMAKRYGIDGFLVFDYWFGQGKRLLEKPMEQVLKDDAEMAYCFCWANHSWYNKRVNQLLMLQQYLGADDYKAYFMHLLPHFKRSGYVKIENKPVFAIFNPSEVPDLSIFQHTFEMLAREKGFSGIFWLAENTDQHSSHSAMFDRYVRSNSMFRHRKKVSLWSYLKEKLARNYGFQTLGPFQYDYSRLMDYLDICGVDEKTIPYAFAGWDTTPRHLKRGTVLTGFSPQAFSRQLARWLPVCQRQKGVCLLLIKSWNEWAEGNVIEADQHFGFQFLEAYLDFSAKVKALRAIAHD